MVVNIIALRWKNEATKEQKNRALVDLESLRTLPGLEGLEVGVNQSKLSKGYETVACMRFKTSMDLKNFQGHPAHHTFVSTYMPLCDAVVLEICADEDLAQR